MSNYYSESTVAAMTRELSALGVTLPKPLTDAQRGLSLARTVDLNGDVEATMRDAVRALEGGKDPSKAVAAYAVAYAVKDTTIAARRHLVAASQDRVMDMLNEHASEIVEAVREAEAVNAAVADLRTHAANVPMVDPKDVLSQRADQIVAWKAANDAFEFLTRKAMGALRGLGYGNRATDMSGEMRAALTVHAAPDMVHFTDADMNAYLRAVAGYTANPNEGGLLPTASRPIVALLHRAGVREWAFRSPAEVGKDAAAIRACVERLRTERANRSGERRPSAVVVG